MAEYVLRRFGQTIVVLLGATFVVFVILRIMPGDPVSLMFSGGDDMDGGAARERYRAELGLDQPLPMQYLNFVWGLARGDFGSSIVRGGEPVIDMVARALPLTIELALVSLVLAFAIALPVALLTALRQNSVWDRGATAFALVGVSMPSFWQGLMLILLLAVVVPLFPVSGVIDPSISISRVTGAPLLDSVLTGNWPALQSVASHMVLPAIVLGTAVAAQFVRVLRSSLLEVKHQDFIVAFRARGIREPAIVAHMLRNALPTTVVIVGMRIGALVSGAIVVETVFSYPGMGNLLVQGINSRDFPVVQAVVVLLTLVVIIANLGADLAHGWLDPRVKLHSKG